VTVVDVLNDTLLSDQNVLIQGRHILQVSPGPLIEFIDTNNNNRIVDGKGKYLIPALWDMHVHLTRLAPHMAYPALLVHGITNVRDMRGAFNETDPFAGVQSRLQKWNTAVTAYQLAGPRIHGFTSFAVEGPHPMFKNSPRFFNCSTPEEARELVTYFARNKISLIKTYNNIPREAFFALMREAKAAKITVAGHKPVRVSTAEASDAGMKSLEHARFFLWDSYQGAEDLLRLSDPGKADNTALRMKILEGHDTLKLNQLFETFRRNGTWYCPTHLTRKADAFAEDSAFRLRYKDMNPILRFLAFEDLDATVQEDSTALGRQIYKDFYYKGLEVSQKAYKHGVKLLAGSDVPELPGSSLHDELHELSQAGIPNFEVLRAATCYPAQYYHLEGVYGSVTPGKVADLVLLSGNPIHDIRNTRKIEGVFFEGLYLDRSKISGISKEVDKISKSFTISVKLVWDMLHYMIAF
jgi:imidazolonepropionase-like amidohydrolase